MLITFNHWTELSAEDDYAFLTIGIRFSAKEIKKQAQFFK